MMNNVNERMSFVNNDHSLRIAIFDDNKNIRNTMVMILNSEIMFNVVGVYDNSKNSIKNLMSTKTDLVIIDIAASGFSGIETIERLKRELPYIQILVQTNFEDDALIYQSILAGASGYILKNGLKLTLVKAVKELRNGGSPMSPSVARKVINMVKHNICHFSPVEQAANYKLTGREKEVLACIVKGKNYKMTGYELNISYETVRSHMKHIYEKLKVASLTELVAKSINFNIV
ncbi:response regulator transcription factor [Mucilaginibacter endophyticus]|uniref:response regulator transcription factor n=1 Tax=Mucilaginibacter endophyticus TaxID=2675003 RepID=UPI001FC90895|nr:response regulator transcription factor [Mucilaginibacter endophyticus]